jgi:tight adherence protein B
MTRRAQAVIDFNVILIVIFIAVSFLVWTVATLGSKGWSYYETKFTSNADTKFEKMFLFYDTQKVFLTNILLLIMVPLLVYFFGDSAFYAVIAFIALLFLPKLTVKILEIKRKKQIIESLPDVLAQISGSMRSGSTFNSAIEIMVNESKGPVGQEFGLLLKEQKMGISQQDALENLGERINSEDVDLVVTAALIARDVGGNLAETFERLSNMLRKKIEMEGKIKALTSQGKLQGWVVSMLPFGIIAALSYVEPEGIAPIFNTYLGWGFLATILILELLGAIMIRKIVSIDV